MRFFDAERKENDKFRRNKQKKNLPWVKVYKGEICRNKDACNKSVDYMPVVFALFPDRIQHKERYKRNRKSVNEYKPPVEPGYPAEDIDQKSKSPYSEKNKRGYNFAVEVTFLFFESFGLFPAVVGTEKIIDGNAEDFAHIFQNIRVGNSFGSFPFGNAFIGIIKKFAEFRLGHSLGGAEIYYIACGYNF